MAADLLMRVAGTVLRLPASTEVPFDAGIDDLEHLAVVGQRFALEVEVTEREGDRVSVMPCGIPSVD